MITRTSKPQTLPVMNSEHLFPHRLTRRDFIKAGTLSAALLATVPLGDGDKVPKNQKDRSPEFIAPHAITVDSKGNFFVVEWVPYGRVRKFAHTPA